MKFTAFILSLFILLMAVTPCADEIFVAHDHCNTPIHLEEEAHNHSNNEKDDCTPFCICQCCGTSITIPQISVFNLIKTRPSFSYSFQYSFLYNYEYSDTTWYPPIHC